MFSSRLERVLRSMRQVKECKQEFQEHFLRTYSCNYNKTAGISRRRLLCVPLATLQAALHHERQPQSKFLNVHTFVLWAFQKRTKVSCCTALNVVCRRMRGERR